MEFRLPTAGRGRFGQHGHGVQETARHVREAASDYYRQGRKSLQRSASNVTDFVEEQPVRTTLVVLGLTCLVVALFIRR